MGRLPNFLTHGAPLRARGALLLSTKEYVKEGIKQTASF